MDVIEEKVRNLLSGILPFNKEAEKIAPTDDLQLYGMDSLNSIQLIVKLEDCFKIQIPEERLNLSFVKNIEYICNLVVECKEANIYITLIPLDS